MDESFVSRRTRGVRGPIACFHLATMAVGLAILSLGAYTINSSSVSCTVSTSFAAIGCFIAVISFIAYFGAYMEHIGFLKTYSAVVIASFVLEIIASGMVYAHRNEADAYGSMAWDFFRANDERLLIHLEQSLHCCGYASPEDRAVLSSAADPLSGCRDAVIGTVFRLRNWIIIGIVVLVTTKLMALFSAMLLVIMIERDADEERTYLTVLSAQRDSSAWYHGSSTGWGGRGGGGGGGGGGTASLSGHSPVFVRHPTMHSSASASSGRSNFFYTPRPSSYYQQPLRAPRYGSTQSTFSFKSSNN